MAGEDLSDSLLPIRIRDTSRVKTDYRPSSKPFQKSLIVGRFRSHFESPRRVVGRPGALEGHPVGSRNRGLRRLQVAAHRLKGPEDLRGRIREESSNIVQLETLIVNRRTVMAS